MKNNLQKDVLLSVRPQYASLLVDGVKKIELRRKFPTDLSSGTRCLIYSSSPVKSVIGECRIDKVVKLSIFDLWKHAATDAMISWEDFKNYYGGTDYGYAVHMCGHIRYDKPLSINIAAGFDTKPPQSYRYLPSRTDSVTL